MPVDPYNRSFLRMGTSDRSIVDPKGIGKPDTFTPVPHPGPAPHSNSSDPMRRPDRKVGSDRSRTAGHPT